MSGFVGRYRAREIDLQELAEALLHTKAQRIIERVEQADLSFLRVGSTAPAPTGPEASPRVLFAGELLALDGAHDVLERGGDALRDAYLRDPSGDFLAQAVGIFRGAIFDPERRALMLVSDPLGLAPVYYWLDGKGGIVFASDQKCFTRAAGVPRDIAPEAAEEFLRYGQLGGDSTWLRAVRRVRPGHVVRFDLARGAVEERALPLRLAEPGVRYASYDHAKRALGEALVAALERATRGLQRPRCVLGADAASRTLLAAGKRAGLALHAVTVSVAESEEQVLAQKVCAVEHTLHTIVPAYPEQWLRQRAHFGYLADGACLSRLAVGHAQAALGGHPTLCAAPLSLAIGAEGLSGFADLRASRLMERSLRELAGEAQLLGNFATPRYPFADVHFLRAALSAEVPYLQHERLMLELVTELYPAYFEGLALGDRGGRTAAQILAGVPEPLPLLNAPPPPDVYAFFRRDPAAEQFVWELLSSRDALFCDYADKKAGYEAFWAFFRGVEPGSFEPLMRYLSLEIWLRQLLRGELLEPSASATEPLGDVTRVEADTVPDVSVIVPAYNVAPYVGECLNSLRNQELANLEILVIDDGSIDHTADIVAEFAAEDPRIRLIRTPNSGVYHARNRGLELARGRFISFVDADDYLHPAMLSTLLTTADAQRAEVVFCDVLQFDAEGETRLRRNTLGFKPGTPLSLASAPSMIADGFSTLWNRIYDRAFLEEHKLKFDERFRISADMLFLQELLAKATNIIRVPRALYYYRFATPSSLTSYQVRNDKYLVHLQITIELIDFWVRAGLFDRYAQHILLRALRNFLWNTHIDPDRLREVFTQFHAYLSPLRVSPLAVGRLPRFERRAFQLIRAGHFDTFMRFVRPYRARMVSSKGGELSTLDRLSAEVSALRAELRKTARVQRDKQAGQGRFRLVWPDAGLGIMFDRGQSLLEQAAPDVEPGRAERVARSANALRQRMYFEAELAAALRRVKKGAQRKVLHFSNGFSVPSETFTYDVITGLESARELDNYVMCFNRQLARERPFAKTIELHGATRDDLEALNTEATDRIDAVLSRLSPDLIHCHFGWVGVPLVLWLARQGSKLPVVITMHGTDVNMWPARHAWYSDALKWIGSLPWVSFTTHTQTYRQKLERLGVPGDKIDVIPNSFDPKFTKHTFHRPPIELGDHLRVISVARMDVWKGHEFLVRGFDQFVRERYSNASLTLVGYGPQESKLRALAGELGIREKVRFYGRAAHHEVPVLLRNHEVYVQPSIRHPETLQEEGQPIAVLEAIATGMPVIVTNTGGMAETVQVGEYEGHAWVVPDQDPGAIAQALDQVIHAVARDEARDAYVRGIIDKHSQQGQLERTRAHYERVWAAFAGSHMQRVVSG